MLQFQRLRLRLGRNGPRVVRRALGPTALLRHAARAPWCRRADARPDGASRRTPDRRLRPPVLGPGGNRRRPAHTRPGFGRGRRCAAQHCWHPMRGRHDGQDTLVRRLQIRLSSSERSEAGQHKRSTRWPSYVSATPDELNASDELHHIRGRHRTGSRPCAPTPLAARLSSTRDQDLIAKDQPATIGQPVTEERHPLMNLRVSGLPGNGDQEEIRAVPGWSSSTSRSWKVRGPSASAAVFLASAVVSGSSEFSIAAW